MTSTLLHLRGLVAGYGDIEVVHGLDLHVDQGEVVALLGANGAGKTTTLLTVSGLIPPLGGSLELFGELVKPGRRPRTEASRRVRAGLGHVPEDRSLFPSLTASENLALAVPWRDRKAAVHRGIELFPAMERFLSRPAGLLSGGEQQMLAIARALVARPRLVMIDELSLGLAPIIVADLLPVLRRVTDEDGAGVLIVEQHVPLVLGVADRAVVLSRGKAILSGAASELAADPSVVAAAYLGPG